jgi:hypothetical protein
MKTTVFFTAATIFALSLTSCKKTEMVLPIDSQVETTIDKSLGSDTWTVASVNLRGKTLILPPTTLTFDKNQVVITSDEIVATASSSFQPNDEILINQFDITQFKSRISPALNDFILAMENILAYQKNYAKITLSAPGITVLLIQAGQKSVSALETNSWEVIDFKCAPKNINFEWVNGPTMSFNGDIITTSYNGLSCNKFYVNQGTAFEVKAANANLGDIKVETMLDIFQGSYNWTVLPNGNLEIKNNNRTKLILKPSSGVFSSTTSNMSVQ